MVKDLNKDIKITTNAPSPTPKQNGAYCVLYAHFREILLLKLNKKGPPFQNVLIKVVANFERKKKEVGQKKNIF